MKFPRLEHAALSLAAAGVRRLGWEQAQDAGAALGRLASRLAPKRRRLSLENIARSFPRSSAAERERWALRSWENLGRIGAEVLWAERRTPEEILEHVRFDGLDNLRAGLDGGGALIHLGHFANWEVAGLAYSALGFPLTVVARRIKNPLVDRRMNAFRERFGNEVLSHRNPFFGCARALKRGRGIGILMDQSLRVGGIFVPFFGRPAATTTLTAHLAHRTGRPILPLRMRRKGREIVGTFQPPFALENSPEETTAALTALIESWVREDPGDWFWFHNRWKRSGEAETAPA